MEGQRRDRGGSGKKYVVEGEASGGKEVLRYGGRKEVGMGSGGKWRE